MGTVEEAPDAHGPGVAVLAQVIGDTIPAPGCAAVRPAGVGGITVCETIVAFFIRRVKDTVSAEMRENK